MRCFRRKVIRASLLREGDRVSGGRSFSWHRFIKFYTARVLLQSRPAPAPSRREPFIESNLSLTETLKICCWNNALRLPSPVGEGAELAEADEVFSSQYHQSLPLERGGPRRYPYNSLFILPLSEAEESCEKHIL